MKALTKSKKSNIITDKFINSITKESSYILGLLWADGHIEHGKYKYVVNIECLSEDMDYFIPVLDKTGDWLYYYRVRKGRKPITKAHTSNKELNLYLADKDYNNKSSKSPKQILETIPNNLKRYFILGVIDGDGCFYFNEKHGLRQFSITGTINQDWEDFEKIFKELGIIYKINRVSNVKSGYSQIRILNKTNILKLGGYLYSTIQVDNIGLPRKHQKYLNIID
jgi:hypothetical protein